VRVLKSNDKLNSSDSLWREDSQVLRKQLSNSPDMFIHEVEEEEEEHGDLIKLREVDMKE